MNTIFIKIVTAIAIYSMSVFVVQAQSGKPALSNNPYHFDVGSEFSQPETGASTILLNASNHYTNEKGYGWLTENLKPFIHKETKNARHHTLIDGISGQTIEFKADLPSGDWWVLIWFEAGFEDSSSVKIMANGENITPQLQAFTPGAEPRESIQKMYRVVQQKITVKNNELYLRMTGEHDKVRLLKLSFIPAFNIVESQTVEKIHEKINEAGVYDSQIELQPLIGQLKEIKKIKAYQNYAEYWILQLNLLQEAEKYFWYRGWSEKTEKTGLGLFDHLHQSVMLYDGILNHENAQKNPIYERALWYRGRLLYWLWLERGIYLEKEAAKRDLNIMKQLHPDDELVRMYNGEKIDTEDEFDNVEKPANAPEWAFSQWEVTNRLKQIADWWVLEQQSETGEFGGKFGDDVEILRFWSPLILSGDSVVYKGWKKLADGVWNSSKIYNGYAKNPSDVEHSSEFISDTAPLMVLYTDDKKYEDRLAYSAQYFRELWTDYNDHGNRFFKSSWFSSTELEMEPPKNRDVPYTTRAVKAVRYYAWKTKDKPTIEALTEWADAWIHATQRTEKEKPYGIIPASVEYPSGKLNGDEPNWYTANMYWDYFDWGGGSAMLDQFLYTWTLTGDDKYLEPFKAHLDLVKEYADGIKEHSNDYTKGSAGWAATQLANSTGFWNVVGVWRLLTGIDSYDEMIISNGTPYIKYRLTGNEKYLVEGIKPYLETVRYNFPMLTSEAIHTDRVHIGPNRAREIEIVQAMITGYGIAESSSPYIAVSWEDASRDMAFLVHQSDSSSLGMYTYSFSGKPEKAILRLWQLASGKYELKLTSGEKIIDNKTVNVETEGQRVTLTFPPKVPLEVTINPISD